MRVPVVIKDAAQSTVNCELGRLFEVVRFASFNG
jgi:hypothetical protein